MLPTTLYGPLDLLPKLLMCDCVNACQSELLLVKVDTSSPSLQLRRRESPEAVTMFSALRCPQCYPQDVKRCCLCTTAGMFPRGTFVAWSRACVDWALLVAGCCLRTVILAAVLDSPGNPADSMTTAPSGYLLDRAHNPIVVVAPIGGDFGLSTSSSLPLPYKI